MPGIPLGSVSVWLLVLSLLTWALRMNTRVVPCAAVCFRFLLSNHVHACCCHLQPWAVSGQRLSGPFPRGKTMPLANGSHSWASYLTSGFLRGPSGHEGGALVNRISALIRDPRELSCPSHL